MYSSFTFAPTSSKQKWKLALGSLAVVIAVVSLTYTYVLVNRLESEERKKARLWANAYRELSRAERSGADISFVLEVISNNQTVPALLVNEKGEVLSSRNIDVPNQAERQEYLQHRLEEMKGQNDPIAIPFRDERGRQITHNIYYEESKNILLLKYFPLVQLVVVGVFLGVSYVAFSSARRSEQNQVWVGLAKETAHQLGTPLSSLLAWLEYFKEMPEEYDPQIVAELEKDVNKLNTITERFSKIGSTPVLQYHPLNSIVCQSAEYMQRRINQNIRIEVREGSQDGVKAYLNRPLFEWVLENLIKNSVDAIKGSGTISLSLHQQGRWIILDLSDTGKGIEKRYHKSIFNPGFTTRRRGWGLGLSLSKRIIEEYHRGQIFVKESEPGKGTTFRIRLRSAMDT